MSDQNHIIKRDYYLNASQLDATYNPDGGGSHPVFTREAWREEVSRKFTVSGYWDWVAHQIHAAFEALDEEDEAGHPCFTVFTVERERNESTTHITSVRARDIEQAKELAIAETASDWQWSPDDVRVLGVVAGDVDILEWDDEG